MKAAVIDAPGSVSIVDVPVPEPGEGQVRLRLEGCGVCASGLPYWQGMPWSEYPSVPGGLGHEAWGTIDDIGPGVGGWTEGERVTGLSERSYAELDVLDASSLVVLPPELANAPVPGEPFGCAFNVLARADVHEGQTVLVVGIGFLGALVTRLAADAGARVIAVSRRGEALALARSVGAAETIPLGDHWEMLERISELTGGAMCERAVEAVGAQWSLDLATAGAAERGRVAVAGYHQDGPRQVDMQSWNWRGLDVVNAHERDPAIYVAGMRKAVAWLATGAFDPEVLLTHRFPLEQLADAFDAARDRPPGFVKASIRFGPA